MYVGMSRVKSQVPSISTPKTSEGWEHGADDDVVAAGQPEFQFTSGVCDD